MDSENISKQGQEIINQVTNALEKTGKKVANQVSNLTDGKVEELTSDAIQTAVDQALNILQVAGERIREKDMNAERVTLEVSISIVDLAHLKITSDVPGQDSPDAEAVDVELNN